MRGRNHGTDFPTQNLTIPRTWECACQVYTLGRFVCSQVLLAERLQLRGRDVRTGLRNHIGDHQQFVLFDFLTDAGAIGHGGVGLQHALDFIRRHAIAEALDDVVLAAQEPEIAILIDLGVIAGEEIAVVSIFGGLVGKIPVAQK